MSEVRAKFKVVEITKYSNSGVGKVVLMPVIGDSEENKKFWEMTPSGRVELGIDNPEALTSFDFGEYYLDFTKAE